MRNRLTALTAGLVVVATATPAVALTSPGGGSGPVLIQCTVGIGCTEQQYYTAAPTQEPAALAGKAKALGHLRHHGRPGHAS